MSRRCHENDEDAQTKSSRYEDSSKDPGSQNDKEIGEVAGRLAKVELENFMCHATLSVSLDVKNNNCFYIGGPNGSGKSALFSAINIGLGGGGRNNDRGNSVKGYIKNGKNSAKIRITLTNTGEGADDKYPGHHIIIERTITQTGGGYKVKALDGYGRNSRETLMPEKKKTDIDKLLARFGIELNNPIYWLSQDKARSFLAQTDPRKMYQIFMEASGLEVTYENYMIIEKHINSIGKNMEFLQKSIIEQKKEFKRMQDLIVRKNKQKEAQEEVAKLQYYLVYAPLKDARTKENALEAKLRALAENQRRIRQQKADTAEEIKDWKDKLAEQAERTNVNTRKIEAMRNHLQEYEDQMRPIRQECMQLKKDIAKLEQELKTANYEHRECGRKISEIEERMANNEDHREMEKLQKSIAELRDLEHRKGEEKNRLAEEIEKRSIETRESKAKAFSLSQTVQKLRNDLYQFSRDLETLSRRETHQLARFGPDMPKIWDIIEENKKYFEYIPKGPIGNYIKVLDKRHLLAIESALAKDLTTFMFNSHKDERVFRQLLNRAGIQVPQTAITRMGLPPHDTRKFEPSEDYLTILRATQIDDTDVCNFLIDQTSIESILIFDTDQEARRKMDGYCPENVRMAYTASGAQVFGSNGRGKGFYRFYASSKSHAKMLTDFSNDQKCQVERQIAVYKEQLGRCQRDHGDAHGVYSNAANKLRRLEDQVIKIDQDLSRITVEIRNKTKQMAKLQDKDDGDTIIQAKQKVLEELDVVMTDIQTKLTDKREASIKKEKTLKTMEKQRKQFQEEAASEAQTAEDAQDAAEGINIKIRALMVKAEKLDIAENGYERDYRELLDVDKVAIMKEIDQAKEKIDAYDGPIPNGMSEDGPDFNALPDTEELLKLVKSKNNEMEANAKALVDVPTDEEMIKKKIGFTKAKDQFKLLKDTIVELRNCFEIRQKKYPIIQHAIIMRLKHEFNRLIRFKFHGNMIVKPEKGEIRIKVKPHSNNPNEELKDIKGLSGGERSYTTTCFFMALWDIMETPFRCMDEFDVFMDGHMRKTAMDLIVKLATEQYSHQQFIFFTPQGINELQAGNRVAVFEMPKVRE